MTRTSVMLLAFAFAGCSQGGTPHDADSDDVVATDAATFDSDTLPIDDTTTDAPRDFTLRARGMSAFQGHAMGVTVVDSTGGIEIGGGLVGAIGTDTFDFRMPALVPAGDYHVDVFVDANANGHYDGPPTDPSWRLVVPGQGSATVPMTASDSTTDLRSMAAAPQLDATFSLTGFTADEMGQDFELRVIDESSGSTVGAYLLPRLTSSSVNLTLAGVVQSGNAYRIDFWSDVDASGTYSGPGSDHTWRVHASATDAGLAVTWAHDGDYVELDWQ